MSEREIELLIIIEEMDRIYNEELPELEEKRQRTTDADTRRELDQEIKEIKKIYKKERPKLQAELEKERSMYTASELQDAVNQRISTDENFDNKFNKASDSKNKKLLRKLIIEVADWMFGRIFKEVVDIVLTWLIDD